MNALDWALASAGAILVLVCFFKGLIRVVFAVLSLVVALLLAGRSTGVGAQLLNPLIKNPALAAVAAFLAVFVLVMVAMGLLAALLSKTVRVLGLGWVDRLGGAVLGLALAFLVTGTVFLVVDLAGFERRPVVRHSALAPVGVRAAALLSGVLPKGVREMIKERSEELEGVGKVVEGGRQQVERLSSEAARAAEAIKKEE